MPARRAVSLVAGIAAVLTACSAFEDPPPPTRITAPPQTLATAAPGPTTDLSAADVGFSQALVRHHAQVLEMVALVPERSDSPEVLALATEVEDARAPQIERVTGWLEEWSREGESETETGTEGLLTGDEMQALGELEGVAFDRLWLESVIAHAEDEISLAERVLTTGTHRATRTLAEEIVSTRAAEITRMRAMLGP